MNVRMAACQSVRLSVTDGMSVRLYVGMPGCLYVCIYV